MKPKLQHKQPMAICANKESDNKISVVDIVLYSRYKTLKTLLCKRFGLNRLQATSLCKEFGLNRLQATFSISVEDQIFHISMDASENLSEFHLAIFNGQLGTVHLFTNKDISDSQLTCRISLRDDHTPLDSFIQAIDIFIFKHFGDVAYTEYIDTADYEVTYLSSQVEFIEPIIMTIQ
jgi:hypothetical protein